MARAFGKTIGDLTSVQMYSESWVTSKDTAISFVFPVDQELCRKCCSG